MVSEIEKIMRLLFGFKEKDSYLCRKNMTKRDNPALLRGADIYTKE